ncbi:pas pac sensor hybrid histidine kinase : Putative uncharacterized protein OS=uncultured Desulfobacterium sp. GN=N47_I07080 PE=4 SV=1: PAS_2: GAF: PHY: PAS_9: PAS_9: PAS_3: HisKA: HATPase_c: Response_reg [Gemmataceae bacterium]|nr:pas pac sensor hybrid histidine kinase : Putative uncharacterized protein OS=uncultured Desulfobacterium sp. GN=N47_I07080 PE=4 SV=1: PAS_2: GAF: PHY: PAS_9: PAS_9: PAS_3: HisKA: HATPase_c: Response_reg [Gemmataceae bacterium]VTU01071.1 pas pac sensor hybrid histidine kinase : Putative uncharacterized protein OS=uncultured Desulfobacterium sp. GN=N47_I07080 PE=4 SV=1: PAS_2: GAF: PHY: PAS_9: PAS_9: PAS_3: HisKA: HATPase_c: Response_reg [Gemmataceae bacterium]
MHAPPPEDPLGPALERCAAEPIHAPGAVQPFAVLLALDDRGAVARCSANAAAALGRGPDAVLGRSLGDLFPPADAARLAAALDALPPDGTDAVEGVAGTAGPVLVHRCGAASLVELPVPLPGVPEGGPLPEGAVAAAVEGLSDLLAAGCGTEAFCQAVVERFRALTGYDRVMAYRFDPDWNGAVIAEAVAPGVDSYLNQHFPAADIPPQARALYARVRVRVLADAVADPVPLLPADAPPLDISPAASRAMSPIHREYLGNMGVRGTLVASVVRDGRLWGMIACHHVGPLRPPGSWVALAGLLAKLVAVQVAAVEGGTRARGVTEARGLLRFLPQLLAGYERLGDGLTDPRFGLMEVLGATGMAVRHGDHWATRGATPRRADLRALVAWLDGPGPDVFVTDRLGDAAPVFAHLAGTAPGVLALRIPNTPHGWILWFRGEHADTVTWAGDYRTGLVGDGALARLGPRRSFRAWVTEVRGRSRPWTAAERAIATEVLRPDLLEVVATAYQYQSQVLRRYQNILFEQVHDAVVVTDLDGVVTFWNDGAHRTLGWRADEVVGRHITARVPDADRAAAAELIASVQAGTPFSGRYRDTRKDGRPVWLDVRLCRIRDDAGHPTGIMAAARDVSDEKEAADQLRMKRAIVRYARDPVLVADAGPREFAALRVVDANPAFTAETGYAQAEAVGRPLCAFTGTPADPATADRLARSLGTWEPCRVELVARRKDGSAFWAEVDLTPLPDEAAGHSHWIAVQRNVTDRKAAEATLRASEERLRLALDAGHSGLYDWDLETDAVLWSPRLYELFGYPPGSAFPVEHRHYADRVHPDDWAELERQLAAGRAAGGDFRHEYRVVHPGGAVRWLAATGRFYAGDAGRPVRMIGTVRDDTARKEAEARLAAREHAAQQAQKLDAIGHIAGGIAHDFNNILTGVRVFADLLVEDLPPDAPGSELADEIRRAAERGANLTRRLLAFSRNQIVRPATVDVNALVADLCEMLRRLIGEDVAVATALAPDAPHVLADKGQLEQVVMNLVLNARDAMPAGGRLAVATAGVPAADLPAACRPAARAPAYLRLTVADTGTGMTDEVKARLFEPFFTTKEPGKGTGLGLATVYGIVRQTGGAVTVDTHPGRGTTFAVYLPAAAPDPRPAETGTALRVRPRAGGATVLVVDDDPMIRRLAQLVLTQAGYRVLLAAGPAEALDAVAARDARVDLLLTDVVMPGLSGRELAERLTAARPGLRVAFLSGYTTDTVLRHGIREERVNFLQKPFSAEELLQFVQRCTGG